MSFAANEHLFRAVVDRVIPPDEWPGGWEGGVGDYLRAEWDADLAWCHEPLERLAAALADACADGADFADRDTVEQDRLLAAAAADPAVGEAVFAAVRVATEGFYGRDGVHPPAGWAMLGFDPGPTRRPDTPTPTIAPTRLKPRYDAVVIGSGLGGAVAASVLAADGADVLVVERAPLMPTDRLRSDHLHGKRAVYATSVGPGPGNPRVTVLADGSEWSVDATAGGDVWGLVAMTVGGGTRLWQGMAWRMFAEDFAMESTYGTPEGADVLDWPVGYAEMEPFYSDAEWELGVAGHDDALSARTPRSRGYPMPPLPDDPVRTLFRKAGERIGVNTGPIPFAINSVTRDGRPPCAKCGQCLGHACPVDAKNGAKNTFLARALRTGNCDLLAGAPVVGVSHRAQQADGVRLLVDGVERTVACDRVVVAAGAVETPRLLQASGLGNDNVGRFLHGHSATFVVGLAPEPVGLFRSPGHSVGTLDFVHDGRAPIGGGVVFDMFCPYPLMLSSLAALFGADLYGTGHKRWMRDTAPRLIGLMSMAQELSSAEGRVRLHPSLRDRDGVPAPIVTGPNVQATQDNNRYLARESMRWLEATDCSQPMDLMARPGSTSRTPPPRIPATEHACGTARMADDPARGATDRFGRLHGSPNVYVSDASLLPSSGGVNPGLTIVANALRVARSWGTTR
ncbi:GMC family oxidoreductase N-terminal domain-containing protein [Yinghuangia sp. YIM S10712]|uniref:GMC family oxidoreductase N-terminal domain-containing protein n=1 Tax=Yinghuangia sp. YIM S10712 TaxID=3436930 RepID=UPI003F52C96E